MTSRATICDPLRVRFAAVCALLALLAGTTGCGVSLMGGPADPTSGGKKSKAPSTPAEAHARAALEPGEAHWPWRTAVLYVAADSLREAEASLERALAIEPRHAPSLSLLARIQFEQRRHAEAIRLLEAARADRAAFPDGMPAELHEALALHYDAADRIEDARASLAAAGDGATGAARAYLHLRTEAAPDREGLAERAAKRNPKSAANQNNLGIARLKAGDPDGAANAFEKAIDLDAALPGPYYNMAILEKFYRLDDAAARAWFRRYRERSNADPDNLAQVLDASGPSPVAERKD